MAEHDVAPSGRAWDEIGSYGEIVAQARKALDVVTALSTVTHALCAIGLDLCELNARVGAVLAERTDEGGASE